MNNLEIISKSLLSLHWSVDVLLGKYQHNNEHVKKLIDELETDRVLLVAYVAEKEQGEELARVVVNRVEQPYTSEVKLKEFDTAPFPVDADNPNSINEMIKDKETIVAILKAIDSGYENMKNLIEEK